MRIPIEQCRNLTAALGFSTNFGSCFIRSTALMLDLPGATLVYGVVKASTPEELAKSNNSSPVPFIHAWVEYQGKVFAPTLIERFGSLHSIAKEAYYETNGVTTTWRLESAAFMSVAKRFKLASAFKHGSARPGKGEVTEAFLNAAKVRYKLSDRRTVLPI
jgi:hypothetical protein